MIGRWYDGNSLDRDEAVEGPVLLWETDYNR